MTPSESAPGVQSEMDTLVSTAWLSEHLDDTDLVVLDCTVLVESYGADGFHHASGRAEYDRGHIPGAGFADLINELSDTTSELDFALPSPEAFCTAMGALGVGDDSRVVLYDDWMGWAARVWWMLRWVGFDRAAILDGGLKAWIDEGRPISNEPVSRDSKQLTQKLRPQLIAGQEEVFAAIDDASVSLIDTMPAEHYRGEQILYKRPGHIPGALNVSVMSLFDESGHYKPQDELATLFTSNPHARTITYCGGGIAASAVAFAMTRLGFNDVAVYCASLQEWAANPENPLAVELKPLEYEE